MANKNRKTQIHQANQQKIKQKQYQAATKHLFIFPIIAAVLTLLALLPFFSDFAEIYNVDNVGTTDGPIEIAVKGWKFFAAGMTGDYTTPDLEKVNALDTFYYYAPGYCEAIAIVSIFTVVIIAICVALQVVTAIKKMHKLNLITAVLSFIAAVLMIVCYAEGVGMADVIIPTYCNGNPACSLKSYAIISAIILLGSTAVSAVPTVKHFKASALLK